MDGDEALQPVKMTGRRAPQQRRMFRNRVVRDLDIIQ
jgi:hypothetical protein